MGKAAAGKKKKGGNPGVGVDFKRVKHKVGKKLPKAQNETRTDFAARSINLPSQSVTADKGGAAVTSRNLTIQVRGVGVKGMTKGGARTRAATARCARQRRRQGMRRPASPDASCTPACPLPEPPPPQLRVPTPPQDLLSQTAHHSERVRKDALAGLQELLTSHPAEARRHAAPLLEKLAARLSDGDAPARAALLQLLRAAALPALGAATLAPFLPMMIAHLEAALTHLEASVRLDALSALEALAAAAPRAFGPPGAHLAPCLRHYTALLSRAHRGRSVKAQALTGLAKVVASLRRFLASALPAAAAAAGAEDGGGAAAEGGEEGDGDGGAAPLMARRCEWGPRPAALGPAQLMAVYAPEAAAQHAAALRGPPAPAGAALAAAAPPAAKPQQHHGGTKQTARKRGPQEADSEARPPAAAGPAAPTGAGGAAGAAAKQRGAGLAAAQDAGIDLIRQLASCWRECAPASLSASPEQEPAQALADILACASALLRGLQLLPAHAPGGAAGGQDTPASAARQAALAGAAAAALMPPVVAAFPATAPAARPPAAVQELVVEFNVLSAQLLAGFLAAGVQWPPRPERAAPAELAWGATLLRYIQGGRREGVGREG